MLENYLDLMTGERTHISIISWIQVLAKNPNNEWTVALATECLLNAKILKRIYQTINDKIKRKKKLGFEPHPDFQADHKGIFMRQREVGPYTTSSNGFAYAIPFSAASLERMNDIVLPRMEQEACKILDCEEA